MAASVHLRAVARAAWEAKETDRIAAAREVLAAVIGAENAAETALAVAAVEETAGGHMVAFVDADGVHVAASVQDGRAGEVWLVRRDDRWTRLGERVESLAHLWELIAEHLPPAESVPAWVQPTGAHDAYAQGDRVMHGGKTWESTTGGNVWEPGVSGWREVV